MVDSCSRAGQSHFRAASARVEALYMGDRIAGAHLVNGRIFLPGRAENFTCTFAPNGRQMILFFAGGRLHPIPAAPPPAPPSPPPSAGGPLVQVQGVAANDVLNVRSGPGTGYRVVGALGNDRWCPIEVMSPGLGSGWVSARVLTDGVAGHLPGAVPAPGHRGGVSATGQISCTNRAGAAMFDCPFSVTWFGNGNASLQVTLPGGFPRRISFDRGIPVASDGPGAVGYTRFGDMVEVRIGVLERYRVFDAVLFGG
jgi:hypothetical protein